jgi:hypothetical protein
MAQEIENQRGRRFQPGDMARIVHSLDKTLIGRIVVVEEWLPECGRWGLLLMTGRAVGKCLETGRRVNSRRCAFLDSSLEPLTPQAANLDLVWTQSFPIT